MHVSLVSSLLSPKNSSPQQDRLKRSGSKRSTKTGKGNYQDYIVFCFVFSDHHFYFPAHLVGGFTLSDLLDKPWSQVSSLLSPRTCLQFLSRNAGFSIPTARRFSLNVANSRSRAFRSSFFYARKLKSLNRIVFNLKNMLENQR